MVDERVHRPQLRGLLLPGGATDRKARRRLAAHAVHTADATITAAELLLLCQLVGFRPRHSGRRWQVNHYTKFCQIHHSFRMAVMLTERRPPPRPVTRPPTRPAPSRTTTLSPIRTTRLNARSTSSCWHCQHGFYAGVRRTPLVCWVFSSCARSCLRRCTRAWSSMSHASTRRRSPTCHRQCQGYEYNTPAVGRPSMGRCCRGRGRAQCHCPPSPSFCPHGPWQCLRAHWRPGDLPL
jgi:hypothetical protein